MTTTLPLCEATASVSCASFTLFSSTAAVPVFAAEQHSASAASQHAAFGESLHSVEQQDASALSSTSASADFLPVGRQPARARTKAGTSSLLSTSSPSRKGRGLDEGTDKVYSGGRPDASP